MTRKMVPHDQVIEMTENYEKDLDDKRKEIKEKDFKIKRLEDEILDNKTEIRALRERLSEKNSEIENMEEKLYFSEWKRSKTKEIHQKEIRELNIRHNEEVEKIHQENQKINNNIKLYEETIRNLQTKDQEKIIISDPVDPIDPVKIDGSSLELKFRNEKAKARKYNKYYTAISNIIEQDFEMSKEYEIKKSELHKILNKKLEQAIGVVIKPRSQIKRYAGILQSMKVREVSHGDNDYYRGIRLKQFTA